MKRNRLAIYGVIVLLTLLCAGCKDPMPPELPVVALEDGFFVLNEGLWQMNNSTLSFVPFNGEVRDDVFLAANRRGLGDTGTDLAQYGGKIYVVVNVSETVEIMDRNAVSLTQIRLPGKQPRKIAFEQQYAYVSCYDGSVLQIDTATMKVTATRQAGRNPDAVCVCNHKLYVANSGGLDYPNYDNTVSVFDLEDFSLLKTITVVCNPMRMKCDDFGDVYLLSSGNYGDVAPAFQRIDSRTDEVVQTFDFGVTNFDIAGNFCYFYNYDYATMQSEVKVLNVQTEEIVNQQFITDGTTIETPYGIAVSPDGSWVVLTDAGNYTTNGDVYIYDKTGRCQLKREVGINPSVVMFAR